MQFRNCNSRWVTSIECTWDLFKLGKGYFALTFEPTRLSSSTFISSSPANFFPVRSDEINVSKYLYVSDGVSTSSESFCGNVLVTQLVLNLLDMVNRVKWPIYYFHFHCRLNGRIKSETKISQRTNFRLEKYHPFYTNQIWPSSFHDEVLVADLSKGHIVAPIVHHLYGLKGLV